SFGLGDFRSMGMRIHTRRLMALLAAYAVVLLIAGGWIATAAGAGAGRGAARGRAGAATGAGTAGQAPAARAGATTAPAASTPASANMAFFESKIRPVLVKECYGCHSASTKDVSGSLFLDTKQGMRRGGDSGPAIIPGNVEASLLIKAIRYTNNDL